MALIINSVHVEWAPSKHGVFHVRSESSSRGTQYPGVATDVLHTNRVGEPQSVTLTHAIDVVPNIAAACWIEASVTVGV